MVRNGLLGRRSRLLAAAAATGAALVVLAGCSAPGSSTASGSSQSASKDLGSDKITLSVLIDTPGVEGIKQLGAAFHKAHPNVTISVTGEAFTDLDANAPRTLASAKVPDIMRVHVGTLVKDKLLTPLDDYSKLYGWNKWPQSQFQSERQNNAGTVRGEGPLWVIGNGYGLTGVYYNKKILDQLGGGEPKTLDDFTALLKKAKDAGLSGIVTNGKDGGLAYPLQNLAIDYGTAGKISDWVFNKPGSSIDTPAMVKAAQTIQDWSNDGYFVSDVNGLDTTTAPTEFAKGQSLFYTSGNWQAPGLNKSMPGNVGFMLFPSAKASDPVYAMSASESLAIPAHAKNKNAAAAFLNFVQTDKKARQITVDHFGLAPAGPSGASTPTADGVVADTLTAFGKAVSSNGLVDFLANSTSSMSQTITPETQLLATNRTTPDAFAQKLQSDYETQIKG